MMLKTLLRIFLKVIITVSLNLFLVSQICADNSKPTSSNGRKNKYHEYLNFLNRLDKTNPASILSAKEMLLSKLSSSTDDNKNDAFRAFWDYYNQVICEANKTFSARGNSQDELSLYRKSGISIGSYEGSLYLKEDLDFLLDTSSITTGGYREYIRLRLDECRKPFVDDGVLMISWDELRQRIILWEQFANQHSQLPETEKDIRPQITRMINIYLTGIDGSRILTSDNRLIDDLKNSYETFLKEGRSSTYYDKIKDVYSIWARNQFTLSKDLVAYLEANDSGYFIYLLKKALRDQQGGKENNVPTYSPTREGPSSITVIISIVGIVFLAILIAQHLYSRRKSK